MPGAIWAFDEKNKEELAKAIVAWAKEHENDPETNFDKWMRQVHHLDREESK